MRDGLKGSVFSDTDTGFVSGKADQESLIAHNVLGCQYDAERDHDLLERQRAGSLRRCRTGGQLCRNPRQHDPVRQAQEVRARRMTTPPPWHVPSSPIPSCTCRKASPRSSSARSSCAPRAADGNSYNTGDAVNAIDWDRTTQYADSVDYVKGLIKLRKQDQLRCV